MARFSGGLSDSDRVLHFLGDYTPTKDAKREKSGDYARSTHARDDHPFSKYRVDHRYTHISGYQTSSSVEGSEAAC
jgi:hypothetical protein